MNKTIKFASLFFILFFNLFISLSLNPMNLNATTVEKINQKEEVVEYKINIDNKSEDGVVIDEKGKTITNFIWKSNEKPVTLNAITNRLTFVNWKVKDKTIKDQFLIINKEFVKEYADNTNTITITPIFVKITHPIS